MENIVLTGRNIVVCYRIVEIRSAMRENFSVVGDEIDLYDMSPFAVVQNASFSLPAGVELLSVPPVPYPTLPLPQEVPAIDVNISTLWTPNEGALLTVYNTDYYPQHGVDLLLMDKITLGGFYFPCCIPRSVDLRYDETGRPLSVNYGFLAPAVFIIPQGSAPPYLPNTSGIAFVRNFTTIVDGAGIPSPLTVVQLTLSINQNVTAQHTTLAVAPQGDLQSEAIRFPRIFTKGVPTVGLQMRTFSPPAAPPSVPSGRDVAIVLLGADLETMGALIEIGVMGYIRNISTDISPDGAVFYNVDVAGGSPPDAVPYYFNLF